MANKDLINLGISPDSGTGDSARRGGEKINNLFADIYSQFGDNPVGQDPAQPFYGYRRPFFEYEYKVGELHPAGRFVPVEFKTPTTPLDYDSEWGWGYDSTGNIIDTDGDGIPDIYRDSEWYFLSRGEQIDADLSQVDSDRSTHFVLPIAVPGDQIVIRDGYSTWKNNRFINIWTTPYEFSTTAQVEEWKTNTGYTEGVGYPDSDTIAIFSPTDGTSYRSNWHKVVPNASVDSLYTRLSQPFAVSRTTNPYDGLSPTYFQNITRYQIEFLFTSYEEGWLMRLVVLDAADISATIAQLSNRMNSVDSDLDRGLYVSADSDIRYTVPLLRRTPDGQEIHGTLSLRGDNDSIMTTIDSEDTALINDPRSALGGDAVQPLTTTIRFKLRDNVKVKDDLFVGKDLEVGGHLQVGETLTVDSDLSYFNNRLQVHEKATFDSDVLISGELDVTQQARFAADVRIDGNLFIGGDSTAIETESLRVSDNLITLSKDADNAPVTDTGLLFQRYDRTNGVNGVLSASDTTYNPFMIWNEQTDTFRFGETASSDSEQTLVANRTYATLGRGLFTLNDSENAPRVIFEKAAPGDFPDDVKGSGAALLNPNERPTVEPDYALHVKANAVFGRDSDDVVVFNSRIMSNIVPFGDELYNLGDSDNKWKDLYLAGNTIHLGSIKLKDEGGKLFITDSDDNRIDLTGADFTTDNLTVDSDVVIGGNSALLGELTVQGHAQFDSDVSVTGNLVVRDHTTLGGRVSIQEGLTVDSDVFLGADLHVDSDAIIKGQLTVGEQVKIDDSLYVADNAYFDSDVFIRGNLTVEDHIVLGGRVLIQEGLTVDSDVRFGNDLQVDSDAIIKGQLTVGEQVVINDTLYVEDNAQFDSDVLIGGNLVVNDHVTLGGSTHILEGLTVDSDVIISADLRVDSDVYIKGDVEIREDLVVIGELNVDDKVTFGHQLVVDSDVFFGSDLRVDSDVHIQGELYVGENVDIRDDLRVAGHATFDSDVSIAGGASFGREVTFDDDVVFMDNAEFDSDVLIRGNLTVNGTTTYVNSTNLEITDNFIVINKNQASPFNDTGIIFQRFDSDSVSAASFNGILEWDEAGDKFILGETGGSGILPNPSVSASYAQFYSSGDVQFFENTGATAKFHWDGADERLGLGITTPQTSLHIYDAGGSTGGITLQDSTAGTTSALNNFIQFQDQNGNFAGKVGFGDETTASTTTGTMNLVSAAGDVVLDALGDITFDADGNNFIYKNGTGADTSTVTFANDGNWTQTFPVDAYFQASGDNVYFQGTTANEQLRFNLGTGTQTVFSSDNLTLDAVGDITFDADGNNFIYKNGAGADTSTVTFSDAGAWTQTFPDDVYWQVTGDDIYLQGTTSNEQIRFNLGAGTQTIYASDNMTLDAVGDITFDADGNNFIYKNGGGSDTSTVTFSDAGDWTQTFPSNYTIDVVGDITFDADGNDFIYKNGAGADTSTVTFSDAGDWTQTFPSNYTVDAVGDIVLSADGDNITFNNGGGNDDITITLGNNSTIAASGDLYINNDGNDLVIQDRVTIGDGATAANGPFVFDITGASDPGGEPVGGSTNRPTLTGDGTGVIDGGTF